MFFFVVLFCFVLRRINPFSVHLTPNQVIEIKFLDNLPTVESQKNSI